MQPSPAKPKLTPARKKALLLMAAGYSRELAADNAGCTYDTFCDHCKDIYEHFGAHSAVEALGKAVAQGEITQQELIFLYACMQSINKKP